MCRKKASSWPGAIVGGTTRLDPDVRRWATGMIELGELCRFGSVQSEPCGEVEAKQRKWSV
jgi:hypothetical protein